LHGIDLIGYFHAITMPTIPNARTMPTTTTQSNARTMPTIMDGLRVELGMIIACKENSN
jgi:hypothetical protein